MTYDASNFVNVVSLQVEHGCVSDIHIYNLKFVDIFWLFGDPFSTPYTCISHNMDARLIFWGKTLTFFLFRYIGNDKLVF